MHQIARGETGRRALARARAPRCMIANDGVETPRPQCGHARSERPHAWEDDARGVAHDGGIGGDDYARVAPAERAGNRREVRDARIDDYHVTHGPRLQACPWST